MQNGFLRNNCLHCCVYPYSGSNNSGSIWSCGIFPLRSPLIGSKLCPVLILATWMFAITTQSPHSFGYKFVEYPEKLACEVRWNEVFDESSLHVYQNYIIVLSIIKLCIPFVLMTILYSIILFKLKTQKVPGEQSVNTENLRAKRQRHVLKMAIVIVSVLQYAGCLSVF